MKKLFLFLGIAFFLCLFFNANALQETAGPVIISTPIGGSNSSRYGLINDGNETIVVSIRAEGDAAKYLSFLENVSLVPKKIFYVNITASLPLDYDTSLGRNITGFIYALQEGTPGQVKINIQLMKRVNIIAYGNGTKQSSNNINQSSLVTGLFAFTLNYPPLVVSLVIVIIVLIVVLVTITFMLFRIKRKTLYRFKRK